MPYVGGLLVDLAEPLDLGIRRFGERATTEVGEDLRSRVKRATPIAKPDAATIASYSSPSAWKSARGRVPGTLKESWQVGEVTMVRQGTGARFRVPVFTMDPVAPHVEWDTVPHLIVPRRPGGVLTVPTRFGMVFAKVVHHPGTRGVHMMATSLLEVAFAWRATVLEEWVREGRSIWRGSAA